MPASPARSDKWLIVVAGVLLVIAAVFAFDRELDPEWADAQAQVRAIVENKIGATEAATLPEGIQQIWIEELDRVDRCVTCHTTVEWGEDLRGAPHPARSHPPGLLASHPVEKFGCTLCHGGQGWATTKDAAHGDVAFWEEPLLDTKRAEKYGLTRAELMEVRCAVCHQTLDEVPQMPLLNAAKERAYDCIDCHRIPELDAEKPTAPDLSHEGEKHATAFHFPDDWTGPRTTLAWQIAHMLDPQKMSPGSAMTKFGMSKKEAAGVSLLVMSWKRISLPAAWTPKK